MGLFSVCVCVCVVSSDILNELLQRENRVLHFWTMRKRRLDQCQQYVVFERSAKQVCACDHVCTVCLVPSRNQYSLEIRLSGLVHCVTTYRVDANNPPSLLNDQLLLELEKLKRQVDSSQSKKQLQLPSQFVSVFKSSSLCFLSNDTFQIYWK